MGESNILHGAMIPRKVTFLDGLTGATPSPSRADSDWNRLLCALAARSCPAPTQYKNSRTRRAGCVRAPRDNKEHYLLELARYIVLNPVRAGKVSQPGAWPWSSYLETAGLRQAVGFLTRDWVLGCLGSKKRAARTRYRQFVAEGAGTASP
jgi:hypothetical protein